TQRFRKATMTALTEPWCGFGFDIRHENSAYGTEANGQIHRTKYRPPRMPGPSRRRRARSLCPDNPNVRVNPRTVWALSGCEGSAEVGPGGGLADPRHRGDAFGRQAEVHRSWGKSLGGTSGRAGQSR